MGDGEDRQAECTRRVMPLTCQETSGQQCKKNTIFFPELGLTLPGMGVEVNMTSAENDNLDQLRACANTLAGNPPDSGQGSRGLNDRLLRMEVELDRLRRRSSTMYTMSPAPPPILY